MSLVSNRPFIDIVAPLGVFRKRKKQQQQQQQNTVKYWGGGGKKWGYGTFGSDKTGSQVGKLLIFGIRINGLQDILATNEEESGYSD